MIESRHILHPGNGEAVDLLREALESICGEAQLLSFPFGSRTFFNVEAEIAGSTSEFIVVGAHLDSTAANESGYYGDNDPAPGADDNLSGVIGVLEAASALKGLADLSTPQRSIRFVLFNAEEFFMGGSIAYAGDLKEMEPVVGGPEIIAMIALDMIGWHQAGDPPHVFEIHGAGTDSSEFYKVAQSSADLAALIEQAALVTSPSLNPQVYPLAGSTKDPATFRSDHTSFQYHDWPACLISEDLFAETCGIGEEKPPQTGNPHYHRSTDVFEHLDANYLADITRALVAATWQLANP